MNHSIPSSTVEKDVPVLSVSQLTTAIKLCLESSFPKVWIQGEISNFKRQSSGHLYFSLKDAESQISAVMFRGDATALKVLPKDGDNVVVRAEVNVYAASGRYQLLVRELRQVGIGELLIKLEELKAKIHKKGWFKKEHKKAIPKFPKCIGVVTSPTGAVIQDILNVLKRRFSGFHLILNPVKVQGEGAATEIAQAIRQFNESGLVDVMIIGRGGGSIEDLWAFNEECVAEAVFNSVIPIICAVGHESDHCIAEYVADVRAPTPSAAAEIVIAERAQQLDHLTQLQRRLQQTGFQQVRHLRHQLNGIVRHPVFTTPYALLGPWMQKLDHLRADIDGVVVAELKHKQVMMRGKKQLLHSLKPTAQIAFLKQKLDNWQRGIDHAMRHLIRQRHQHLNATAATLKAIDPKNLLKNGYSILFSEKEGTVIKSVREIEVAQEIRLMMMDGEALTTVKKVFPK